MLTRVILIGGSSHSGKSALAEAIGARLGWRHVSTDSLARHPGRPWAAPPGPAERFRSLAVEHLIVDVQAHYQNLWPQIDALITSGDHLVLEGSALWPERVSLLALGDPAVRAGWLTASAEHLMMRVHKESGYATADDRMRALIDNFLARTVRFDEVMMDAVTRRSLVGVRVDDIGVEELAEKFLEAVGF